MPFLLPFAARYVFVLSVHFVVVVDFAVVAEAEFLSWQKRMQHHGHSRHFLLEKKLLPSVSI